MEKPGKWYAVYTKPRWEKKIDAMFGERGITSYCPLNKVRRKWSDRFKVVEEPLFKSYVFVRITDKEMSAVRQVSGVINFVYWNNKPATIKDEEVDQIKRFLNEYQDVQVVPMEIKPQSKVLITKGIMMNKEAEVVQVRSKMVEVIIECLGYKLTAQINKSNITPIS
jgi:transcription antitermination factor NusG